MDGGVADLALRAFVGAARNALQSNGLTTFWYHTSSTEPKDRVVSMGGVQPDTGRNVYGLRHAVSILIETRGVGLGRAHLARRVHSHVLATMAVLNTAAEEGPQLMAAVAAAGQATALKACKGDLVIQAQASPAKENLQFVDATTGADRTEEVDWRSALTLKVNRTRARPCGYWLGVAQADAVNKLQALGVKVTPWAQERKAVVEAYRILTEKGGQRLDARGVIATNAAIREVTVETERSSVTLPAGGWYVGLDQPLGSVVAAALEPDTQNSYTANHVMAMDSQALLRVMQLTD